MACPGRPDHRSQRPAGADRTRHRDHCLPGQQHRPGLHGRDPCRCLAPGPALRAGRAGQRAAADLVGGTPAARRARIDALVTGYTWHRAAPTDIAAWAAAAGLQIAAWRYDHRLDAGVPPWLMAVSRAERWAE